LIPFQQFAQVDILEKKKYLLQNKNFIFFWKKDVLTVEHFTFCKRILTNKQI